MVGVAVGVAVVVAVGVGVAVVVAVGVGVVVGVGVGGVAMLGPIEEGVCGLLGLLGMLGVVAGGTVLSLAPDSVPGRAMFIGGCMCLLASYTMHRARERDRD